MNDIIKNIDLYVKALGAGDWDVWWMTAVCIVCIYSLHYIF